MRSEMLVNLAEDETRDSVASGRGSLSPYVPSFSSPGCTSSNLERSSYFCSKPGYMRSLPEMSTPDLSFAPSSSTTASFAGSSPHYPLGGQDTLTVSPTELLRARSPALSIPYHAACPDFSCNNPIDLLLAAAAAEQKLTPDEGSINKTRRSERDTGSLPLRYYLSDARYTPYHETSAAPGNTEAFSFDAPSDFSPVSPLSSWDGEPRSSLMFDVTDSSDTLYPHSRLKSGSLQTFTSSGSHIDCKRKASIVVSSYSDDDCQATASSQASTMADFRSSPCIPPAHDIDNDTTVSSIGDPRRKSQAERVAKKRRIERQTSSLRSGYAKEPATLRKARSLRSEASFCDEKPGEAEELFDGAEVISHFLM